MMIDKENLRKKAEEMLSKKGGVDNALLHTDITRLVEELSIYQIELEHQNQQLIENQLKLEQEQRRSYDLFNNAPIGYFIVDKRYVVTEVNQTACDMIRVEFDQIKGSRFTQWIHPEDQDQFYFFFREVEKIAESSVTVIRLKEGADRYFFANITAVPDSPSSDSSVWAVRIAVTDISIEKELEKGLIVESDRARESERLKSAFLANMSHEIRTPLNAILGFSSLIYEDGLDSTSIREYAEIILRNGERLLALLNDILDLSKIESGSMRVERRVVPLVVLIDHVIELFSLVASKKNIALIKRVDPQWERTTLMTDKSKLMQVLSNLVSNALKFTHEGCVEIGYRIDGERVVFSVKDTGIGISEEGLSRLFERFYQVEGESSFTTMQGTGLGLSLSKSLVELLKGEIWVESELDKGSCFNFSIPYEGIYEVDTTLDLGGRREVLLVEDDERQVQLIKVLLEKKGLNVAVAMSAEEALMMLLANPRFNLVLMDINMPFTTGFEAFSEIRKLNPIVPIVAITGFSEMYTKDAAIGLGFDDYYVKPITAEWISKIITKYIVA